MKYLDFVKSNAFIRAIGNAVSAGCVSAALSDRAMGITGTMLPANIAHVIANVRELVLMSSEDFDRESYDEAKRHPDVQWQYIAAAILSFATLIMMIIKCVDMSKAKKERLKAEKKAAIRACADCPPQEDDVEEEEDD